MRLPLLHGRRIRGLQRIARLLALGLLVGAAGYSILLLRPLPAWIPPALDLTPSATQAVSNSEQPLDLAVVAQRNLRQPLVDPVPVAATPQPEAPPPLQLTGTVIEGERRFAVLTLASGATVVREIGAVVEGYELLAVERGLVRLRRGEKSYELRVPWYQRLAASAAEGVKKSP